MYLFNWKQGEIAHKKESFAFKQTYSLEERKAKKQHIDQKYTGNRQKGISYIVLQKGLNSKIKGFKKPFKLLAVDSEMRVFDLMTYIRQVLGTNEKESIFLIIGKTIANSNYTIGELYQSYAEEDSFLYVLVSESEVF